MKIVVKILLPCHLVGWTEHKRKNKNWIRKSTKKNKDQLQKETCFYYSWKVHWNLRVARESYNTNKVTLQRKHLRNKNNYVNSQNPSEPQLGKAAFKVFSINMFTNNNWGVWGVWGAWLRGLSKRSLGNLFFTSITFVFRFHHRQMRRLNWQVGKSKKSWGSPRWKLWGRGTRVGQWYCGRMAMETL